MKPPERVKEELVEQWFRKAEDDFEAANDMLNEGESYRWIICYHAQQAAEKYLKAYLVQKSIEPPRVHDLTDLLKVLSLVAPAMGDHLHEIRSLSIYAVDTRYPGDLPAATSEEAREAVQLAGEARRIITEALQRQV